MMMMMTIFDGTYPDWECRMVSRQLELREQLGKITGTEPRVLHMEVKDIEEDTQKTHKIIGSMAWVKGEGCPLCKERGHSTAKWWIRRGYGEVTATCEGKGRRKVKIRGDTESTIFHVTGDRKEVATRDRETRYRQKKIGWIPPPG